MRWRACVLAAGAAAALAGWHAETRAAAPAGHPRCFGAASRDPGRPCRNRALDLSVVPTPKEAEAHPSGTPCRDTGTLVGKRVCEFGARADRATATVALVGDSHAGMWRAALDTVVRTHGWRGIHLGHASCPLSKALRDLTEPNRSHCARWKRAVFRWFGRHPEVSTVFVSELSAGSGFVPRRGQSRFGAAVEGYKAAWHALPRSVRRIVVIRDTPKAKPWTLGCVERAMARRQPAGTACAVPRSSALDSDPAVAAVTRMRSPRVRSVDLTRFFCDSQRCFPVIGGALVYKDNTHVVGIFAETLGPYLLRDVDRLLAHWTRR